MNVAQETLGLRRAGLSPALSLLMSAVALPIPPACLTARLRRLTERSPTRRTIPSIHSHALDRRKTLWPRRNLKVSLVQAFTLNELWWIVRIRSFGVWFEPRYIFRAGRLDQ